MYIYHKVRTVHKVIVIYEVPRLTATASYFIRLGRVVKNGLYEQNGFTKDKTFVVVLTLISECITENH